MFVARLNREWHVETLLSWAGKGGRSALAPPSRIAALDRGGAPALDALTFAASAALLWQIRPASTRPRAHERRPFLSEVFVRWGEFPCLTWLWAVVLELGLLNALVFGPSRSSGR